MLEKHDRTEEQLLRAISERPEDLARQSVYADWLEESGDADRAAFVRVSLSLRRLPAEERPAALRAEWNRLLTANRERWERPLLRLGARGVEWDFGFPTWLTIGAADFLRSADRLLRLAPLQDLRLLDLTPPLLERLAATEALASFSGLSLVDQLIGDKGLRVLLASPHLQRLQRLHLVGNLLTDKSARLLADSPVLSQIRVLDLTDNRITEAGAQTLVESPWAGALEALHLPRRLDRED